MCCINDGRTESGSLRSRDQAARSKSLLTKRTSPVTPGFNRMHWRLRIIRQLLYGAGAVSDKFVPVLFFRTSPEQIRRRSRAGPDTLSTPKMAIRSSICA
jgi:hypothetical protein